MKIEIHKLEIETNSIEFFFCFASLGEEDIDLSVTAIYWDSSNIGLMGKVRSPNITSKWLSDPSPILIVSVEKRRVLKLDLFDDLISICESGREREREREREGDFHQTSHHRHLDSTKWAMIDPHIVCYLTPPNKKQTRIVCITKCICGLTINDCWCQIIGTDKWPNTRVECRK